MSTILLGIKYTIAKEAMQKTAKDYIIFPLDFPSMGEAQSHIRQLDGRVGMFKIGLELFIRQGPAVVEMVRKMSSAGIFLDLKLHDISATVGRAMARVADLGVDLVTVHGASCPKMLRAAVENAGKTKVLAVTLLTDNDADTVRAQGFKDEYVHAPEKLVLLRARMALDAGCAGVVCSGQEAAMLKTQLGQGCLTVTPGIRPQWSLPPGMTRNGLLRLLRRYRQVLTILLLAGPSGMLMIRPGPLKKWL